MSTLPCIFFTILQVYDKKSIILAISMIRMKLLMLTNKVYMFIYCTWLILDMCCKSQLFNLIHCKKAKCKDCNPLIPQPQPFKPTTEVSKITR